MSSLFQVRATPGQPCPTCGQHVPTAKDEAEEEGYRREQETSPELYAEMVSNGLRPDLG